MCGIFGALGPQAFADQIAAAAEGVAHRGPDGRGGWTDTQAGLYLAHFRLAIIDPTSASNQPFETDRATLIFNGEIYNYKELRDELRNLGIAFQTQGDTEVLIRALEVWGSAGLNRVRGMFAFAYWDKRNRELLLVRDRFGIKPLYVMTANETTVFASEIEALRRVGWSKANLDARSLYHALNYLPAPYTFYDNIRKLLPGELLRVSSTGTKAELWYRLSPREHGRVEDLLRRSVAEHTRCDVEYGVFLSGGLDSAIIASLVGHYTQAPPSTYSIGFSSFPAFDEGVRAANTARSLGCKHFAHDVLPAELEESMEHCLTKTARGEPFADGSFVPTWLVSRAARTGI